MAEDAGPNILQKSIQRIAATSPGAKVLAPTLHHMDRFVLRASGGRATATGLLTGMPVVTLTTIGAKSGQVRSVPLAGIPDGDKLVLIASNFGQTQHPAWYHNLKKHPQATVTIGDHTGDYVASEAGGKEYERLWQIAVSVYAGYAAYKTRTGGRQIPIIVLKPDPTATRPAAQARHVQTTD